MADDEREIDAPGVDAPEAGSSEMDRSGVDSSGMDPSEVAAYRVDTPEEDERLAESQRKIDEAKVVAADLAKATPDPLPDSAPPQGSTPAS